MKTYLATWTGAGFYAILAVKARNKAEARRKVESANLGFTLQADLIEIAESIYFVEIEN
jgi:hypothetical protein